jgi:hypothetical protein
VFLAALAGCRIGFDPIGAQCVTGAPCVEAVTINAGAAYTGGPRLAITAQVSGGVAPLELRVTEGPCAFADDSWQAYDAATSYNLLVEPVDGMKQACVWARDANSAVSPVQTASISFEAANLPVVEAFDVVALDATHLSATWTLSDVEGLAANPVDLDYRTGTTWLPIALGIGAGATGSFDFVAPTTTSSYVVRLTPTDRAGNRGVAGLSDIIGAPRWSIYAGSPGHSLGNAARSIEPQLGDNATNQFAVDPQTLDAYVVDRDDGIVRIDGATGQTEQLIAVGTMNLPNDGVLDATSTVTTNPVFKVGPDGMLYVADVTGSPDTVSAVLYQIDPQTRHCRRYLGGGTAIDQTATASTVYFSKFAWAFDEDGALYFLTNCTPGTLPSPYRMRLLKAAKQPDGTAGAISVVAGSCAAGTPPAGPVDATTVPLGVFTVFAGIGTLAVADHGRAIYLASYTGRAEKVIDGQHYASDLPIGATGSMAYDVVTGTLLVADGDVREYTLNRTGTTDPLLGIRIAQTGTGTCVADGIAASDACVHVGFAMQSTADRMYFADGLALNENRTYRVRFVDRQGLVRTYIGALALYGEGQPRRLVRSRFGGISYKAATAPNQTAFPAGLYFADSRALVLGRIDDTTERVSIVWGNQSGVPRTFTTGDPLGPNIGVGRAYYEITMQSLVFDAQGLPIVRYGPDESRARLLTADPSGNAIELTTGGGAYWENAADGTNPAALETWPYATANNLTLVGATVFMLGGAQFHNPTATLRSLDFTNGITTRIMGTGTDAYSPDTATPANASISGSCHNDNFVCFTQYRAADNRLYFSEDSRLRYITTPTTPASAALGTLFTVPTLLRNFTFRPDGSQVYYTDGGVLACHNLSSSDPTCNDTPLGPPNGTNRISSGPDQLTWKDNNTLLISTNNGFVLQYTAP